MRNKAPFWLHLKCVAKFVIEDYWHLLDMIIDHRPNQKNVIGGNDSSVFPVTASYRENCRVAMIHYYVHIDSPLYLPSPSNAKIRRYKWKGTSHLYFSTIHIRSTGLPHASINTFSRYLPRLFIGHLYLLFSLYHCLSPIVQTFRYLSYYVTHGSKYVVKYTVCAWVLWPC